MAASPAIASTGSVLHYLDMVVFRLSVLVSYLHVVERVSVATLRYL